MSKEEKDDDDAFFYVKVNMDLLMACCSDEKDMKRHDIPIQGSNRDGVSRQFSLTMKTSKQHVDKITIHKIGLNSKYCFILGDYEYFSTGILSEFDGVDGTWSLMTHCNECFREFLGFPRINPRNEIGCPSINCACNIRLRNYMKQYGRFMASVD